MNPGDAITWANPKTGKDQSGVFVCIYSRWYVIETVTGKHGHLGLRYVDPRDVRPTPTSTPEPT